MLKKAKSSKNREVMQYNEGAAGPLAGRVAPSSYIKGDYGKSKKRFVITGAINHIG